LIKKRSPGTKRRSGEAGTSQNGEPGDGSPDEAAIFIAETAAALAALARRHDLNMLIRLLEMTRLEAEEFIRLRGRRKPS
jgi:hypothetical protein